MQMNTLTQKYKCRKYRKYLAETVPEFIYNYLHKDKLMNLPLSIDHNYYFIKWNSPGASSGTTHQKIEQV